MAVEPHVAMIAKRVFPKLPVVGSRFTLAHTPQNCYELRWFLQRYPLVVDQLDALEQGALQHEERIMRLDTMLDRTYTPREFEMAIPPRVYQKVAAELAIAAEGLLLADDVGLGKTASSIAAMTHAATQPVLVVTLAPLQKQWEREINRFAPKLFTHILKRCELYELPKRDGRGPDVIITSYAKMPSWCDVMAEYCNMIVLDECQECRHSGSQRYTAIKVVTSAVKYRLGLSATPIYNFGGEMWNVMEQLTPGELGSFVEFDREWLVEGRLKDPDAFGAFLRDRRLMLRRTAKEVDRELPKITKITVPVDSNPDAIKAVEGRAGELARLILNGGGQRGDAMQAASEFDVMLRQATGLAKAPYVAEFCRMLLTQKIPTVLFGWHHAVYEIWMEKLKDFKPALYTGLQSLNKKQSAVDSFIKGETDLLILSLRAGAGLDGLQKRCCTTVHGEFDWSPGVIEQNIGRVARDQQEHAVMSYMMMADVGTDPLMAETLGLKADQIEGIRGRKTVLQRSVNSGETLKKLARQFLDHIGK